MKSRSDLLIGCLNLLRGYQDNSLRFLRGAIEACAFGAKIKTHPHPADVWFKAVDGDAEYRTFRKKFTSPFHPIMSFFMNYASASITVHR
jgi:hypothetical protein